MPKRVLFVCMGNICRSPAAEAVLKQFAENAGLDVEVDSAGTIGYHAGDPADGRMIAAARRRGYELTSRARQVTQRDMTSHDLVIALDRENFASLQRLAGRTSNHVQMMSDFLGDEWPRDVPDPYYGEEDGFEYVLDMIEGACPAILKSLAPPTAD